MKIMTFAMFDVAKGAEVAAAADKVAGTPGTKRLAQYIFQGNPFPPTVPPNSMVGVTISEVESNDALAAANYPVNLAGATTWSVPVLEMSEAGAAETEKQYRG
jgi:hypothetical protein